MRDRAVFLLDGNGNELPSIVELAGCASRNGLMVRHDAEGTAPDEPIKVRVRRNVLRWPNGLG